MLCISIGSAFFCFQCTEREPDHVTITVRGSTTIATMIHRAAKVYKPHVKVDISNTGSTDGIDALINGQCDIAASSREISPQEVAETKKQGIKLKQFLIAFDMIVSIVHPKNPVDKLDLDQLQGIFTGAISRWSEVGGNDNPIKIAVRDAHSGTFGVWNRIVGAPPENNTAFVAQPSNSSVSAYVAEHPDAVGYVSYAFLNSEVKALKINGIDVTEKKPVLDRYPLKRNLYLYVNAETFYTSQKVKSFVIFLLMTPGGESAIRDSGFFPVSIVR